MNRRLVSVASMSLFSLAAIVSLNAGAVTPPKGRESVGTDRAPDSIPELARYQRFTPTLPDSLPAHFELAAPIGGEVLQLSLDKHSVRGDHFQVLVDRGNRVLETVDAPAIRTYRGEILDRPGTSVTGSLLESGFNAIITLEDGSTWGIQPLSDFRPDLVNRSEHVVYSATDVVPDGRGCALGRPGFPMAKFRSPQSLSGGENSGQDQGGIAGTTPQQVEIACETDYEFFTKNASSIANTINDVELIISNVNTIYDRDVNTTLEIGTIVVRSTSADPYTTTTIDGRLTELGTVWSTAPESGIMRDVVHMFSGYNFSGGTIGLAYLGGVCTGITQGQYGVAESRYTTTTTYRVSLSAHELGHNFDATHCDSQGTSACHIMCSSNGGCGGVSGTNLKLDPLSISEMTTYLTQVACDFTRPAAAVPPFTEPFASGTLTTARWTYNDGAVVSSAASNEPSAPYALLLNSTGTNTYDDDEIRSNFILLGGTTAATASYKVERTGVETGETLIVEYLNNTLDWTALNTLTSDGTAQTAFATYSHSLPASARHNQFRIRFRTNGDDAGDNWFIDDVSIYTTVPPPPPANDECIGATTAGLGATSFDSSNATDSAIAIPAICTANSTTTISKDVWFKYTATCAGTTTVSTCGSAAFDTRLVVYINSASCPTASSAILACNDNGTGCASSTSSATFTSTAGSTYHIRVGGATSTAGGAGSVNISCTVACPSDLNGDSIVNASDLSVILANWGGSGAGDVNGSGNVDAVDLSAVLAAWGSCP